MDATASSNPPRPGVTIPLTRLGDEHFLGMNSDSGACHIWLYMRGADIDIDAKADNGVAIFFAVRDGKPHLSFAVPRWHIGRRRRSAMEGAVWSLRSTLDRIASERPIVRLPRSALVEYLGTYLSDLEHAVRAGFFSRLAGWLLAVATYLVPPPDRADYREEFTSELREIAASQPRRQQIGYAWRTLCSARALRRELRGD